MLTIKNRVMAAAALFSIAIAAPISVMTTSAEAAIIVKQTANSGVLVADRDDHHDGDYEYSERHGRYINAGRHRRHHKKKGNYQYSNPYYQRQQPQVIYTQPQVIYQPQVVTTPQARRCVRTLYSTICN